MIKKNLTLQELNKKFPERRNKPKTYVSDFQYIEAKDEVLDGFEKETLLAISYNPAREIRLAADMSLMVAKFPASHRIILERESILTKGGNKAE